MKGLIVVYASLLIGAGSALFRPAYGVVAYFGFATLIPTWLWRWSLPEDPGFQKYLAYATFAGIILTGFRGNRIRGGAMWAAGGLTAFLVLSLISLSTSVAPEASARHVDVLWKIVIMTAVAMFVVDSPRDVRMLSWVLVLCQGLNAWEINLDYFQNGRSWAAFDGWGFLDNNTYSLLTIPVMALSVGLALYEPTTWARGLAGGIFVLQLHQVMLLESRGAMLGGILLVALAVFLMPKTRANVAVTVTGALVGVALAGPPVVEEFSTIFASEGDRDSSADSRFGLWQAGAAITKDYPLLGCGPDAASRLVPQYYPGGLGTDEKALHNLFFDVSAGTGVPSVIAFFSFFGIIWYSAVKSWRLGRVPQWAQPAIFAVLCGTPAYLLASMFSSGLRIETPYIITALAGAALLVLQREEIGALDSHALEPARTPLPEATSLLHERGAGAE